MDTKKKVGYKRGCLTVKFRFYARDRYLKSRYVVYGLKCDCGKVVRLAAFDWGESCVDCGCGIGKQRRHK